MHPFHHALTTPDKPACIMADTGETALVAVTPGVGTRLMLDGCIAGCQPYEATLATYPAQRIADETAGGDMLYSSGTTGRPKGVFAPPESPLIDASNSLIEVCKNSYGINGQSIYLSPAPLYHAAPLRFNMVAMRLGATCVVMPQVDFEAELPRHPTGKLYKRLLRDRYWVGRASKLV